MITAKVRCSSKTVTGDGDNQQASVTFSPDYGQGRNAEWALATPYLDLRMMLNGRAAGLFEQGAAYELQFVETD